MDHGKNIPSFMQQMDGADLSLEGGGTSSDLFLGLLELAKTRQNRGNLSVLRVVGTNRR